MKAIVLGATGLTGSHLLTLLLEDDAYSKVVVITRRSVELSHPKLEEHCIDMLALEQHRNLFQGDVVFVCIGTTKAKTPNKEEYYAIDYGIPVTAAKHAKANGITKFMVISALGANEKSRVFYNRLKGEMERDVLAQEIPETHILQPSLIVGNRNEKRAGEDNARRMMKFFDFMIPPRYKMIQAEEIAQAMIYLSKTNYEKVFIPSDAIRILTES